METNESNKEHREKILGELGEKIELLVKEAKLAGKEVGNEMNEKIRDLHLRKEEIGKQLDGVKSEGAERWGAARTHLTSALEELKCAVLIMLKKED